MRTMVLWAWSWLPPGRKWAWPRAAASGDAVPRRELAARMDEARARCEARSREALRDWLLL